MKWWHVAVMALFTYLFRAAGLLATRSLLPAWLQSLSEFLPAALLSGLVAAQVFGDGSQLTIDARFVGFVVALLAAWRHFPLAVIIIASITATAFTRLLVGG